MPCTANTVPPPRIFLPMRLLLGTVAFVFVFVVATGCDRGRTALPAATLLEPTRTNRRRRQAASTRPATAEITARSRHQSRICRWPGQQPNPHQPAGRRAPDQRQRQTLCRFGSRQPARRRTQLRRRTRRATGAIRLWIVIEEARGCAGEPLPNPHRRRGPNVRSSTSALRCASQPISRAARIQYLYTPFR